MNAIRCDTGLVPREHAQAPMRFLGEGRFDLGLEPLLRIGAGHSLDLLPVLEDDQRRDRQYVVLDRRLLVLVGVELRDLDWPAFSAAISSTTGATIRHGPHQGAQKSTSTGTSDSSTSAWKLLSVTSETLPAISAPLRLICRFKKYSDPFRGGFAASGDAQPSSCHRERLDSTCVRNRRLPGPSS